MVQVLTKILFPSCFLALRWFRHVCRVWSSWLQFWPKHFSEHKNTFQTKLNFRKNSLTLIFFLRQHKATKFAGYFDLVFAFSKYWRWWRIREIVCGWCLKKSNNNNNKKHSDIAAKKRRFAFAWIYSCVYIYKQQKSLLLSSLRLAKVSLV